MGNNLVAVARACANSLRFTPIRSSRNRLKVDDDGKRKLSMKEREVLIYICSVTAERKTKRRAPFTFFQNRQKTIESLWSVTPDEKGYRTKNEDLSRCLAGLVDSGLLIPQQQSGRGIVTEYRINVELMLSTTEEEATLKAARASLKSVDVQEQEKIDAERKYEQSKKKIWHLVDKLEEKVYCLESEFNEAQAIEHLTGSIDKAECIYCRQICNRRYHGASMDRHLS